MIVDICYTAVVTLLAMRLGFNAFQQSLGVPIDWKLPFKLLGYATLEEILFRFIPLGSVICLGASPGLVLLTAVVSSIIFGLSHGRKAYYLFSQGAGGLIYSLLFLKCGGFQKEFLTALLVVIIAHALFNIFVALFLLICGEKEL